MTDEEKKLIDSFIEYFGADKIIERLKTDDIVEEVGTGILDYFDDYDLINAVGDFDNVYDYLGIDDIILYLEGCGYEVNNYNKNGVEENMSKLQDVCRNLKPKGYIDKEEAKKLITDYLEFWMNRTF